MLVKDVIREAMARKDWSQADLAKAVRRTRQAVNQILNKEASQLSPKVIHRFAKALDIDVASFFLEKTCNISSTT